MAAPATVSAPAAPGSGAIPPLESGDRLTRAEFERRYEAMPELQKAELVEEVVIVPSPVRIDVHGSQTGGLSGWLAVYRANTPGTQSADNTAVRLDVDNEHQPAVLLRILPSYGGQSRTGADGYVEGAPELLVEVAASSTSIDLHDKNA